MAETFAHLLSPLRLGPRLTRNRVLVTGHVAKLAENNRGTPALAAYHAARARGGAGLQITGAQAVHPTGRLGNPYALEAFDDAAIPGFRLLTDAVHGEGGLILGQLGHAAATVGASGVAQPLWAPSAVAADMAREVPHVMSRAEIAEMVGAYAAAAARMVAGGFDGVEILAAFGFLPVAFLSPLSNRRDDAYGGPLENRLRFVNEVIAAVRGAVGRDHVVGLRLPGDERVPGGLTLDDMTEIARRLAAGGRLDYLNVIAGTNMDRIQRWEHWPPTPAPHGLFVPLAAAIKRAVSIPVFTTGRVTDPRLAEAIVRDGQADMVGMTRAHIADPELVAKLSAGRLADLRPCVGANVCIAPGAGALKCFHNPETGREQAWGPPRPAARPRRVAVIGGGPAGLEAARVAALRGHHVTLYEQEAELGGQLRRWAASPQNREFLKSLAWFEGQLERLQVKVERGRALTEGDLAGLEAEVILLATGARARAPCAWPGGADSPIRVLDAYAVIDRVPPGVRHALLRDEGSGKASFVAAELLLAAGARVTLVSSEAAVGEAVEPAVRVPLYKLLLGQGAVFRPNEQVLRLEGDAVVTRNLYSGQEARIEAVDLLVDWSGAEAQDELAAAARAGGRELRVLGDALAPRTLPTAIAEGALAAREI
jgi:2,4-dienoyl-CoA reductase-like NADH-dependent reductase (Old Yellow Enzyme family)/thioredoxin reductase